MFKQKNVSDSDLNKLDKILNFWSTTISEELLERKFLEVKSFSAFAKTRLFQAISDCVKIDVQESEEIRQNLVNKYGKSRNNEKQYLASKIAEINLSKKRANRLKYSLRDYNEYDQLKKYIKQKFGQEVVKDFYDNFLDKPENVKNKLKT